MRTAMSVFRNAPSGRAGWLEHSAWSRIPCRSVCTPATAPQHRSSPTAGQRSEEHTSELQSRGHLVCRLLLEKKKKTVTFCLKVTSNDIKKPTCQAPT